MIIKLNNRLVILLREMQEVTKSQLESLQTFMKPNSKKFNILEILEKFPKCPQIHQLFKDVCIHYQTSVLNYQQINQYTLNSLNRAHILNNNQMIRSINRNQRLYIAQLQTGQFDYHISLISNCQQDNSSINTTQLSNQNYNLVSPTKNKKKTDQKKQTQQNNEQHSQKQFKSQQRIRDISITLLEDHKTREQKVYAITHKHIKHFSQSKAKFVGEDIKIKGESILFASCYGNLVGLLTYNNKFYLQVDPLIMKSSINPLHKKKAKINIIQNNVVNFHPKQQIIGITACFQNKWLFISKKSLWIVDFNIEDESDLQPTHIQKQIIQSHESGSLTKMVVAKQRYVILITSEKSMIIFDLEQMKISNRIYNDSPYLDICFNQQCSLIICSDHSGFLFSMLLNDMFGDTEEQGITYKKSIKRNKDIDKTKTQSKTKFNKIGNPKNHRNISEVQLAKQRKTPFTTIIENSHKRNIEIIKSKEKSIFTYESLGEKMIKVWDVETLRVYQKVGLSMEISNFHIGSHALYLASLEKGYLSYYKFQKHLTSQEKSQVFQVSEIQLDSNYILIKLTSLKETIFYKLKLSHIPKIYPFHSIPITGAEIKTSFNKNQVMILNIANPLKHKFQILGGFGEKLQMSTTGYNEYHYMIDLKNNKAILWGPKKITIMGMNKNQNVYNYRMNKKDKIYSNMIENQNMGAGYRDHILFIARKATQVKYFSEYVIVMENDQKFGNNVYLVDEKMMTVIVILSQIPSHIQVLSAHKYYIMFEDKKKKALSIYDIHRQKVIWKSEVLSGWNLESGDLLFVNKKAMKFVTIYRSNSIVYSEPVYLIIQTTLNCEHETAQKFLSLPDHLPSPHSSHQKNSENTYTFEDLLTRSIANRIKFTEIQSKPYQSYVESSNSTKVYFPEYCEPTIKKMTEGQLSRIQGKILEYLNQSDYLVFYLMIGGVVILFDLSVSSFAEIIGIIDVNNRNEKMNDQDMIVEWDENYKLNEQKAWNLLLKDADKYLSRKNSRKPSINVAIPNRKISFNPESEIKIPETPVSPYKLRRYKTEDQEFTNHFQSSLLLTPKVEREAGEGTVKKKQSSNAKTINNIFYRDYIQKNIKEEELRETKNIQARKSLIKKNKKSIHRQDIERIMAHTENIKKKGIKFNTSDNIPANIDFTLPSRTNSTDKKLSKKSLSTAAMGSIQRARYLKTQTPESSAMKQLDQSMIIQKLLLPAIESKKIDSTKTSSLIKAVINNHLKKQSLHLQKSRRFKFIE